VLGAQIGQDPWRPMHPIGGSINGHNGGNGGTGGNAGLLDGDGGEGGDGGPALRDTRREEPGPAPPSTLLGEPASTRAVDSDVASA